MDIDKKIEKIEAYMKCAESQLLSEIEDALERLRFKIDCIQARYYFEEHEIFSFMEYESLSEECAQVDGMISEIFKNDLVRRCTPDGFFYRDDSDGLIYGYDSDGRIYSSGIPSDTHLTDFVKETDKIFKQTQKMIEERNNVFRVICEFSQISVESDHLRTVLQKVDDLYEKIGKQRRENYEFLQVLTEPTYNKSFDDGKTASLHRTLADHCRLVYLGFNQMLHIDYHLQYELQIDSKKQILYEIEQALPDTVLHPQKIRRILEAKAGLQVSVDDLQHRIKKLKSIKFSKTIALFRSGEDTKKKILEIESSYRYMKQKEKALLEVLYDELTAVEMDQVAELKEAYAEFCSGNEKKIDEYIKSLDKMIYNDESYP